jgi:hypothetical protein
VATDVNVADNESDCGISHSEGEEGEVGYDDGCGSVPVPTSCKGTGDEVLCQEVPSQGCGQGECQGLAVVAAYAHVSDDSQELRSPLRTRARTMQVYTWATGSNSPIPRPLKAVNGNPPLTRSMQSTRRRLTEPLEPVGFHVALSHQRRQLAHRSWIKDNRRESAQLDGCWRRKVRIRNCKFIQSI